MGSKIAMSEANCAACACGTKAKPIAKKDISYSQKAKFKAVLRPVLYT